MWLFRGDKVAERAGELDPLVLHLHVGFQVAHQRRLVAALRALQQTHQALAKSGPGSGTVVAIRFYQQMLKNSISLLLYLQIQVAYKYRYSFKQINVIKKEFF